MKRTCCGSGRARRACADSRSCPARCRGGLRRGVRAPSESVLGVWDRFVAGAKGSDLTQLSGWAWCGAPRVRAVVMCSRGSPALMVGGAQVMVRRIPLVGRIGYVATAVIARDSAPGAGGRRVGRRVSELGRGRLRALFVQPIEGADVSAALLARGFRDSTAGVAPPATVRIDCPPAKRSWRAGLSKRFRRWTGKWAKPE